MSTTRAGSASGTGSLRAVPDLSCSAEMAAASDAARAATVAANNAGALRLEAAHRLVGQFTLAAREAESAAGGRAGRTAYARLDPQARARDHVAAACQLTCWHAARLVTAGVQVHTRLPRMLSLLEQGLVPEQLAIDVACWLAEVPDEVIGQVEGVVMSQLAGDLEGGDRPSRSAVEGMIDRAVEAADPELARTAAEEAYESRMVRFRSGRNGMARMWARLPAAEAELLRSRIEADASVAGVAEAERAEESEDREPDDRVRTRDQLRADALTGLAVYAPKRESEVVDGIELGEVETAEDMSRPTIGNAAAGGGQPIRISVIASATRGVPDQVEFVPGAYAGYEWLTRQLLEGDDARVRFQLVDPVPGAMDTAEHALRYVIPAGLAERVRLRDGTCRHPGCTVDARDCDIDHVVPFDHDDPRLGGPTMEWNLVCLCRKHHREKTFGGSHYRTGRLGMLIITTDTGHTHHTRPIGPLARAREGIRDRIANLTYDARCDRTRDRPA